MQMYKETLKLSKNMREKNISKVYKNNAHYASLLTRSKVGTSTQKYAKLCSYGWERFKDGWIIRFYLILLSIKKSRLKGTPQPPKVCCYQH